MDKKAITWEELADAYDSCHSNRKARTLPMDEVFDWGEKQKQFWVDETDGSMYRV
jgi:hypothetical protein